MQLPPCEIITLTVSLWTLEVAVKPSLSFRQSCLVSYFLLKKASKRPLWFLCITCCAYRLILKLVEAFQRQMCLSTEFFIVLVRSVYFSCSVSLLNN